MIGGLRWVCGLVVLVVGIICSCGWVGFADFVLVAGCMVVWLGCVGMVILAVEFRFGSDGCA